MERKGGRKCSVTHTPTPCAGYSPQSGSPLLSSYICLYSSALNFSPASLFAPHPPSFWDHSWSGKQPLRQKWCSTEALGNRTTSGQVNRSEGQEAGQEPVSSGGSQPAFPAELTVSKITFKIFKKASGFLRNT